MQKARICDLRRRTTKMPTKNRTELIETIWAFVQKEEETIPEDMKTPKKDIEEAVSEIDGELRISGETGNNFSDFFVNFEEGEDIADELIFYLGEHGFETSWACPGYMVVGDK